MVNRDKHSNVTPVSSILDCLVFHCLGKCRPLLNFWGLKLDDNTSWPVNVNEKGELSMENGDNVSTLLYTHMIHEIPYEMRSVLIRSFLKFPWET